MSVLTSAGSMDIWRCPNTTTGTWSHAGAYTPVQIYAGSGYVQNENIRRIADQQRRDQVRVDEDEFDDFFDGWVK